MADTTEKWDTAAGDYQRIAKLGINEYNSRLLRFWQDKGMLYKGARVLDIGCGVGKYGVYLAELGCDVTLTDISGEMLRHARENMARFTTPWTVYRCDFDEVSGKESVFAESFDLSISTMSPAVHDEETVKKMSAMTHGWCFLARFYEWKQPVRDRLLTGLGLPAEPAMPGTKADCEEITAAIAAAGFAPQLEYADYSWADVRTAEEFAGNMLRRHPAVGSVDRERLIAAAKELDSGGGVVDEVYTKVAWIYWKSEGKR